MRLENPREFARRVRYRPSVVELLEGRQLLATLTVINTADSGTGSLRDAITTADLSTSPTTIKFDIPGTGVQDIDLVTPLPDVASPITIDGTSQPGFAGTPLIEILGAPTLSGSTPPVPLTEPFSIRITGNNSTVEGLAFNGDPQAAIFIQGSDNLIAGDAFGLTVGKPQPESTQGVGIGVQIVAETLAGANDNTVGGTTLGQHNTFVIGYTPAPPSAPQGASTSFEGIVIGALGNMNGEGLFPSTGNLVEGNTITSVNLPAIGIQLGEGNPSIGIDAESASSTTIGGTVAGAENVVERLAVGIQDGSKSTLIEGNAAIANGYGVSLGFAGGSSGLATVGGTTVGTRNVLSGNLDAGIFCIEPTCLIEGNSVGTNYQGTAPLLQQNRGIDIEEQDTSVTIGGTVAGAGNIVANNTQYGIVLNAAGPSVDLVEGNLIGTDVTGTLKIPNGTGIFIENSSNPGMSPTIGGTVAGAGNVISGNLTAGIDCDSAFARIEGNLIGTDITGSTGLGNGGFGIVAGGNITIGGTIPGARNVISGNQGGIEVPYGVGLVEGNFVGTDLTGTKLLGNATVGLSVYGTSSTIGGTTPNAANVISGNGTDGVFLQNPSVGNVVQGNLIGTDVTGTAPLGNALYGVVVSGTNNTLGGAGAAANQILYNGTPIYSGGVGNVIAGNVGAASADLLVSSSVPRAGPAVVGMPVPYSFYVTNQGPETATGIELAIVDLFPQNASLVGIYPSQGTITVVNPTASFVNIGTLAPGSVVSVAVIVVPRVAGGNSTVYAFAGGSQFDPNPDNNAALANIPVVAAPSLSAADVPLLADSAPVDPRKRK